VNVSQFKYRSADPGQGMQPLGIRQPFKTCSLRS